MFIIEDYLIRFRIRGELMLGDSGDDAEPHLNGKSYVLDIVSAPVNVLREMGREAKYIWLFYLHNHGRGPSSIYKAAKNGGKFDAPSWAIKKTVNYYGATSSGHEVLAEIVEKVAENSKGMKELNRVHEYIIEKCGKLPKVEEIYKHALGVGKRTNPS